MAKIKRFGFSTQILKSLKHRIAFKQKPVQFLFNFFCVNMYFQISHFRKNFLIEIDPIVVCSGLFEFKKYYLLAKIYLSLYPPLGNLTTRIAVITFNGLCKYM